MAVAASVNLHKGKKKVPNKYSRCGRTSGKEKPNEEGVREQKNTRGSLTTKPRRKLERERGRGGIKIEKDLELESVSEKARGERESLAER